MPGMTVVKLKPQSRKDMFEEIDYIGGIIRFMAGLRLLPRATRVTIGDNKIYIYWEENE